MTAEGDAVLDDEPFIHMLQGKKTQGSHSSAVMVQEYEARCTLRVVDPRKTARRVLSECAHQLSMVFTKIISASLSQSFSPPSLNSATIVPLPRDHKQPELAAVMLCRLKPITHQHRLEVHGWSLCAHRPPMELNTLRL